MPSYKTPGVYIEELPAAGPIQGVGTSTAALLGPAQDGLINVPTKITNFTEFRRTFGGYINGRYLAHAVRGFFENGGTVAYVTRVGTAVRAFLDLDDRQQGVALVVRAKKEGIAGNSIKVSVEDAQIVDTAKDAYAICASAETASTSNNVIKLRDPDHAKRFKSGDFVQFETGPADRSEIDRVRGDELILVSNVKAAHAAGVFVRIADLAAGQRTFRVENGTGIEPGSALKLTQDGVTEYVIVDGVAGDRVAIPGTGLKNTYKMGSNVSRVAVTSYEFTLIFSKGAETEPAFANLSMDPRHSRYFSRVVASSLVDVALPLVPSVAPPPFNRPALIAAAISLASGTDDNLGMLGPNHYQAALDELEKIDDVNLVCAPDLTSAGGQAKLIAHCEKLADRFAVLDSAYGLPPFGDGSVLQSQRPAVESARGYAALYYPWIQINDPQSATGDDLLLVPPSGHIAGICARTDADRGVHKAPANELIRGAVGLERVVDKATQGELNEEGINVIRIFPGGARPIVWGARTTAPKDVTAWRYVNVRRLFLFIEESIQEGLRWSVFEPNDLSLWKKLDRTITEFLTRVWRSGALFGATASEAFYVKIDEELNPPSVRSLGQVIIEIGVAPVRPAEFVVVKIGMWDGGARVTEG